MWPDLNRAFYTLYINKRFSLTRSLVQRMSRKGLEMSIPGGRSNDLDNQISSWTFDSAAEKTEELEIAVCIITTTITTTEN